MEFNCDQASAPPAGLVDHDQVLVELDLEGLLLQARRDVRFAARSERNDVLDRFVGICSVCRGGKNHNRKAGGRASEARYAHGLLLI